MQIYKFNTLHTYEKIHKRWWLIYIIKQLITVSQYFIEHNTHNSKSNCKYREKYVLTKGKGERELQYKTKNTCSF